MRLKNVTFENWLSSHREKDPEERWLRELYPWPVIARVECCENLIDQVQKITWDGVDYEVTLRWARWQPNHGTFKYRLLVESDGLGWHARPLCDEYDVCATPGGSFVTLFHTKKFEPLEKIAKAFFARRWEHLRADSFKSLAISRFLAASIVGEVAEQAFPDFQLQHYPEAKLIRDPSPMLSDGSKLWLGYRFFSEDAYQWARCNSGKAARVIALYFADTKYQFRTDLPSDAEVQSISQLDSTRLGGRHEDLIIALLRQLELPTKIPPDGHLAAIVHGIVDAPVTPVREIDVNEALAALKRPCFSKAELRYQLASGVVLNSWIEEERRLGFRQRKKFYAFKERIGALVEWAATARLRGVKIWEDNLGVGNTPILYVRIDDVDFSFH